MEQGWGLEVNMGHLVGELEVTGNFGLEKLEILSLWSFKVLHIVMSKIKHALIKT